MSLLLGVVTHAYVEVLAVLSQEQCYRSIDPWHRQVVYYYLFALVTLRLCLLMGTNFSGFAFLCI